jgi:hypothetical protein
MYGTQNWCGRAVYVFAIYQIFICYVIIVLAILIFIIFLCYAKCYVALNSSNTDNPNELLYESYSTIQNSRD